MLKKVYVNRGRIEQNREGSQQQPPVVVERDGEFLHGWDIRWSGGAGRIACDMSCSPSVWIELTGPIQVLVDKTMEIWRTLD
jgi:hypothetical protein